MQTIMDVAMYGLSEYIIIYDYYNNTFPQNSQS